MASAKAQGGEWKGGRNDCEDVSDDQFDIRDTLWAELFAGAGTVDRDVRIGAGTTPCFRRSFPRISVTRLWSLAVVEQGFPRLGSDPRRPNRRRRSKPIEFAPESLGYDARSVQRHGVVEHNPQYRLFGRRALFVLERPPTSGVSSQRQLG
jgi:hypothetical protein